MKRLIKIPIVKLKNKIKQYPRLKNKIVYVLNYFPNLKIRLRGVTSQNVIYENWKSTKVKKELLIDVSHLYKEDLKTGIQRVVRSVLNYLEKDKTINLDIQISFDEYLIAVLSQSSCAILASGDQNCWN